MQPEEGGEKTPRIPDSVLRAALLRRAVEDIRRLIQIKNAKQACSSLLQRGSVGDDLWQRFQRAEKEMEAELRDVVQEVSTDCVWTLSPLTITDWCSKGQCPRPQLGSVHLPVRPRDGRQRRHPHPD